ncbi:unnamed protein product [Lactuca saligna]|uniref:Uncharacterized protein n=1 Tax=Lactuca saligna TaxID=75948 RepID=A0AA35ZEQ9_LACSI|nr:unnamed protein product [Lactuca saligna]
MYEHISLFQTSSLPQSHSTLLCDRNQKRSKKKAESSSPKVVKKSKKKEESYPPPIMAKKPEETVLPSRTGLFNKLKKKERPSSPAYMVKPQITRTGVIFREVQEPVSPASKKRQAEDIAKHISNKSRKKL